MAKPARKVVRLTDRATRTRAVRSEIDATKKRLAEVRQQYGTLAFEKLFTPVAEQMEAELSRLDGDLLNAEARLWRLENGLPEEETKQEPEAKPKAAAPTSTSRPAPRMDLAKLKRDVENLPPLDPRFEPMVAAVSGVITEHLDNPEIAFATDGRHFLGLAAALSTAAVQLDRLWQARAAELDARIEALEATTDQVLTRGIFYAGTWQKALGYDRGSAITHAGSLWIAVTNAEQGEAPGASDCWQLAAKRGRDGKDAPGVSA